MMSLKKEEDEKGKMMMARGKLNKMNDSCEHLLINYYIQLNLEQTKRMEKEKLKRFS